MNNCDVVKKNVHIDINVRKNNEYNRIEYAILFPVEETKAARRGIRTYKPLRMHIEPNAISSIKRGFGLNEQ